MSIPHPSTVDGYVNDAIADLVIAADAYRWAYNLSHDNLHNHEAGDSPPPKGGVSNPTASAAINQQDARDVLAQAAKQVRQSSSHARGARAQAAKLTTGGQPPLSTTARTITKAEEAEAREAQARRLSRREGWGDESLSCT